MAAMIALHAEYGEHFDQVFQTITVDNGSEFADFAQVEKWGAKVYFAHPYTSWERPQNERHNGLFRAFLPKGKSIEQFTDEDILAAADELNGRPRRKLGYRTRRSCLNRSWTLCTQPDGCGTLAPGQSLRLHPRPRLSTTACPTCYCN